jgi:hypothetical protein
MTQRHLGAALCCVVLAACTGQAPLAGPPTAAPTPAKDKPTAPLESKPSARFIGFVGPRIQHDPPFLGVPYTNFYCLRSFLDRQTGATAQQLYVADSYSGTERDWNGAQDAEGHALPFTHISTNKITCDNGCAYAEEFAATLPEAELSSSDHGLTVTFAARSGNRMTIALSGAQVASQLAAVDAARARLSGPAAASAARP